MSLVTNALYNSFVVGDLIDAEVDLIATLVEVKDYQAGAFISWPGDDMSKNLYILISGQIEVVIEYASGSFSIQLVRPGDLAGVINFSGVSTMGFNETLIAVEPSQVIILSLTNLETLIYSHPSAMYGFYRGLIRHSHRLLRNLNAEMKMLKIRIEGQEYADI